MSESRNLVKNPLPVNTNGWLVNGNIDFRMSNDGTLFYLMSNDDENDKFIHTTIVNMPAGGYVFEAYVLACQEYVNNLIRAIIYKPTTVDKSNSYAGDKRIHTLRFTVPETSNVQLRLMCPRSKGKGATYRHLLLCTAADYERMHAANVTWFSGSSFERGGGLAS